MKLSIVNSLNEVAPAQWDRLAGTDNPFVRHAFLSLLEQTGCVNAKTGWAPCHLLLHADGSQRDRLLGAVPLYLKSHSYGEYVFDWAWADAYERAQLHYYPKLVAAVPFTPVTGPRLLVDETCTEEAQQHLAAGALALATEMRVSSLHWLFVSADQMPTLLTSGHLRRTGYQFHWRNPGYSSFEDFLTDLASAKRKKVKRERRHVRDAGIIVELMSGDEITPPHWDTFYQFYLSTIRNHGAIPYLRREFFEGLGAVMADRLVLVLARCDGRPIAGALNLRGETTLYGRYWGAHQYANGLHFEVCYYAAMEYCIERGLARFEAGAQGEHKLARGFLPTTTYSAHWLSHSQFERAVADFLGREQHGVGYAITELNERSPFKHRDTDSISESPRR
jgi:predicted N-acyltransferase